MLSTSQKNILLNIVASPFFLALPIAIAVILFLPNPSSKYKVELSDEILTDKPVCQETYCDLNNDGVDERVVVFHNLAKSEAAVKVITNNGVNYEQWNFHGHFQKYFDQYYCADLNKDGYKEIYVFYYKDDSVFMGTIQPYPDKVMLFNKKFVTTVRKRDGNIDYRLVLFKLSDIDNDGYDELLFLLNAGFSRQPRSVFIYDYQEDSFQSSKPIGTYFSCMELSDLDNDSVPEIYCGSSTAANIQDSLHIPYNDYSSWFLGFNKKLELLFPPVEQKAYPSSVKICNYINSKGKKFIAAYYKDSEHIKTRLVFYGANAKEYSSINFKFTPDQRKSICMFLIPFKTNKEPYVLFDIVDGYFVLYNENLIPKKIKTSIENVGFQLNEDLDNNGTDEYVFLNNNGKYVTIFDNNLKNPVSVELKNTFNNEKPHNIGVKHNKNKSDELFIKAGDYIYFYTYRLNYLYYLKYPMWILIYGFIALLLWFSQRMQKILNKRKQQIEETINSLQMKTIKSQMDPHFMFNVLNGLANNVAIGNTNEAYNQITRFSTLLRSMMKRSDRIDIGLGEEIEFIRNYLELEKFRFKDNFEYAISIAENVDLKLRLPRMLIQLLVENSIKHGLRDKEGIKKLTVNIQQKGRSMQIVVEDNGIGRKEAMKKSSGTGKGMKLIRDMIRLNSKLGGKEIVVDFTDLYNKGGKAAGTKVVITLERSTSNISST